MKRKLIITKTFDWTTVQLYDIMCSDGTFVSPDAYVVSRKTGVGVVYWVNSDLSAKKGNRIRIISKDVFRQQAWSTELVHVPGLTTINEVDKPSVLDWDGRGNTDKVLAYSGYSDSKYSAFATCNNYFTQGTNKGDWYLGSIHELNEATNVRRSGVNTSLLKIGGIEIKNLLDSYWYEYIRASTQTNSESAWVIIVYTSRMYGCIGDYYKNKLTALNNDFTVRPMLIL